MLQSSALLLAQSELQVISQIYCDLVSVLKILFASTKLFLVRKFAVIGAQWQSFVSKLAPVSTFWRLPGGGKMFCWLCNPWSQKMIRYILRFLLIDILNYSGLCLSMGECVCLCPIRFDIKWASSKVRQEGRHSTACQESRITYNIRNETTRWKLKLMERGRRWS